MQLICIKDNAVLNNPDPKTTVNHTTMTSATHVTTNDSTSESTTSENTGIPLEVQVGVPIVILFGLLATVVALLFLVYYKRKRSDLVNLTKPHKGSEENSYASSEHSHQQGSKYSESPEPGYDVIKPKHTKLVKVKSSPSKLRSTHIDMNPTQLSEYASIEDNYSKITDSSSHNTIGSHDIVCSCEHSTPSRKDSPSINSQCGDIKREVFIADSEIMVDKDKQKQLTEDAAKCNNNCIKGEASPIPPQTIEMMYTAVQKQPKVNSGMDSEFEDSTPPLPLQTTEMMYTAVQKRPKDSILAEVEDNAPPVPPYMEKEDKETEATAKGSDEGSPPPIPP